MEIICKVPDERAEDFLDLLRSIVYVSDAHITVDASDTMDATEYLLASEANADSLRRSLAQARRGEVVRVEISE